MSQPTTPEKLRRVTLTLSVKVSGLSDRDPFDWGQAFADTLKGEIVASMAPDRVEAKVTLLDWEANSMPTDPTPEPERSHDPWEPERQREPSPEALEIARALPGPQSEDEERWMARDYIGPILHRMRDAAREQGRREGLEEAAKLAQDRWGLEELPCAIRAIAQER